MNILQVSTQDTGGGAERVAWNLFSAYRERGHASWLAVGRKRSDDADVVEIPRSVPRPPRPVGTGRVWWVAHGRLSPLENKIPGVRRLRQWCSVLAQGWPGVQQELEREDSSFPGGRRLRQWCSVLGQGWPEVQREWGREDFAFPGTRLLQQLPPARPDIVHAHNLHGDYFDLRILPRLSREIPVVLTLHDAWLLSGHCAHSLGCERWRNGCGHCPDLTIYPAIRRDATAWNWRRKRSLYRRSHLYVAAPSRWLLDQVRRSMLVPVEGRVVHNGVDLRIYHPSDQRKARAALRLPMEGVVLLFTARSVQESRFKDYGTIERAIRQLDLSRPHDTPLVFVALGSQEPGEDQVGQVLVKHVAFQSDPEAVAQYFQAADIYLHAAHTDTFPTTVLEALACGVPVIASAVGGIPEQIEDGVTGFLIPPRDSSAMADRIGSLLEDRSLRLRMGVQAAQAARTHFDLNRQVDEYLTWYQEILRVDTPGSTVHGLVRKGHQECAVHP